VGRVFAQGPTLADATKWAEACKTTPSKSDYRALLEERAPNLLKILYNPTRRAILGGGSPEHGGRVYFLDDSRVVGNLYELGWQMNAPINDRKMFSALFAATNELIILAPESNHVNTLVQLSHDAWTTCFTRNLDTPRCYRSRATSMALVKAHKAQASTASVWLGKNAELPPFFQLPALHTLEVLKMDAPFDLRPLQGLVSLKHVIVGEDTPPDVIAWFHKEMAQLCPAIRVTTRDCAEPAPDIFFEMGYAEPT
jgi:hypothetical protein